MSDQPRVSGHQLDPILRPESVVVVGASADPGKRGNQVLSALSTSGFAGAVYPVNPRGGEIHGLRVFASMEEVPEAADLALICLPAAAVPDAVRACGVRGVSGAVVLAVGFGESGEEGERLAEQLMSAATETGIRVVGPNTSGILNLPWGLNLIGARGVRSGGLSLLVQSGNVALSFMNEVTVRSRDGIAVCVGVGNELDIGFHEYLSFLGDDPDTDAIAMHVEGFTDARAFVDAASEVTNCKPVVLLKGARSESGQAAARSHTGAVAGEYDRLSAAFRQAGIVEVTRADELFHVCQALATQPAAAAGGVAILSDGGGQGTLASDALSDMGVPLALLTDASQEALRELLGRAANTENPCDLAGAADRDPEVFARALDVLAADPGVGAVLVVGLFGGYAIRFAESLARVEEVAAIAMASGMEALGKPIVVHTMYAAHPSRSLDILRAAHVPVVESLDVAVRCIGELWLRGYRVLRPRWDSSLRWDTPRVPDAGAVLDAVGVDQRDTLTEPEAAAVLTAHGLTFPHSVLCSSLEEVPSAVETVGTPVALKAVSSAIPHKTDAGGVALDLASAAEAIEAFSEVEERCRQYLKGLGRSEGLDGVLVTRMLGSPLAELLIGARMDDQLGPMLTIGAGGTWIEIIKDVTHRVLPVSDSEIADMLLDLQSSPLLNGARGRSTADVAAVVQAAQAVSRCLLSDDRVLEVEVNPLFVYAEGALAVDARMFVRRADQA